MPYTILVPDHFAPPPDVERAVLGADAEFLLPAARSAREVPAEMWPRADAALVWHDVTLDAADIARMERCRVIVRVGAGYDNIDLAAAGRRGIAVCCVPDYGVNDVADHALAMLLALYRGLFEFNALVQAGGWDWGGLPARRRVTGETLAVIGLGRIGTAAALRAKAHGMRVAFYDPYKPDGFDKALGLERFFDLPELLAQADAVTFHVPLTAETRGMAGETFFAALKPGAFLVNTARGPVVDLDALERALRAGRVQAAALDVLPQEPPDPEQPLLRAWRAGEEWVRWRLIVTPHAAFYNEASFAEIRRKAAQEALRVLQGQPPRNCVNREYLLVDQQHVA
jgi:phosphoglycerate dehydrogenase-like enzyme